MVRCKDNRAYYFLPPPPFIDSIVTELEHKSHTRETEKCVRHAIMVDGWVNGQMQG